MHIGIFYPYTPGVSYFTLFPEKQCPNFYHFILLKTAVSYVKILPIQLLCLKVVYMYLACVGFFFFLGS